MNDFIKKLRSQIVYLWDDEDQVYIKSEPKWGYFVKFKENEYPIEYTHDRVVRALAAEWEVSKETYDSGLNQ